MLAGPSPQGALLDSPRSSGVVVAFAGGGTGGHLYPALALAEAIQARVAAARFVFFATGRAIDRRILGSVACEVVAQPVRPPSVRPWRWPGFLNAMRLSRAACRRSFDGERPDVVVGTGGFASVPALLEARRQGIPTVVFNPDVLPGRANRLLSRRADLFVAQWEDTRVHLSPRVRFRALGCPIRASFLDGERRAGIDRFELDADRRTLLVTGASQGARTINEAMMANLRWLAGREDWQVLHLTGDSDYETVLAAYRETKVRSVVLRFTDHMADAMAAADLIVARAGASTLAEITAVGRASILLPYPYHRDQHQLANARVLVRRSAARLVEDRKDVSANGAALRDALESLMDDEAALRSMAAAARRIGSRDAAARLADEVLTLARPAQAPGPCEMLEAMCQPAR